MKKLLLAVLALVLFAGSVWAAEPFPLKDIKVVYNKSEGTSSIKGEITNDSGKNHEIAIFKLRFYDEKGKLLGPTEFTLYDFKEGDIAAFEGTSNDNLSAWKTYKISLDGTF